MNSRSASPARWKVPAAQHLREEMSSGRKPLVGRECFIDLIKRTLINQRLPQIQAQHEGSDQTSQTVCGDNADRQIVECRDQSHTEHRERQTVSELARGQRCGGKRSAWASEVR